MKGSTKTRKRVTSGMDDVQWSSATEWFVEHVCPQLEQTDGRLEFCHALAVFTNQHPYSISVDRVRDDRGYISEIDGAPQIRYVGQCHQTSKQGAKLTQDKYDLMLTTPAPRTIDNTLETELNDLILIDDHKDLQGKTQTTCIYERIDSKGNKTTYGHITKLKMSIGWVCESASFKCVQSYMARRGYSVSRRPLSESAKKIKSAVNTFVGSCRQRNRINSVEDDYWDHGKFYRLIKKQKGVCAQTNIRMQFETSNESWYASIDRIDNTRMYVKDNVQLTVLEYNVRYKDPSIGMEIVPGTRPRPAKRRRK